MYPRIVIVLVLDNTPLIEKIVSKPTLQPTTNGTSSPISTLASTAASVREELPQTPEDQVKQADLIKEQGNVAFKAGGYGEAVDLYSKAIDLNLTEVSFICNRAAAQTPLKRFRAAIQGCKATLIIAPTVIETEGGEVPSEWRAWSGAGMDVNDALRLAPISPDTLTLHGLVLLLMNRLPLSLQHLASALRFDAGHVPAQQLRKRVKDAERLKDGNALRLYSGAIEQVEEKEEKGKGGKIRAVLLSNRATILLKFALNLLPKSFKALRTRARIHLRLERFDASIADFKSAIENASPDADRKAVKTELKKAEAALKRSKPKDYGCGDEEKFKLVVEANAVLSDPQRRERYDMYDGEDGINDGGMGGMSYVDLADLFAQFHGNGGGGGS
ncbi:hypothetical protein BDQ17DRAFT_1391869 [Cyathus striatus]|nr:hypothetical protein BDQ17DRAFT_1391869 [Cyathus striatus]